MVQDQSMVVSSCESQREMTITARPRFYSETALQYFVDSHMCEQRPQVNLGGTRRKREAKHTKKTIDKTSQLELLTPRLTE